MHILLIPSTYPSSQNPIRGIFYKDQALALQRAGHEVRVLVSPRQKSRQDLFSVRKLQDLQDNVTVYSDLGIDVYHSEYWYWSFSVLNSIFPGCFINAIQKKVTEIFSMYLDVYGLPDIIHAHNSLYGGISGAFLKQKFNIPLVITEHSSAFLSKTNPKWKLPFIKNAFASANAVFAVSDALAGALDGLGLAQPVSVLGNIIDTDYFVPAETPLPHTPFIISSIGFLNKNKGFDILIRSFKQSFYQKSFVLNIVGDGAERKVLEKLVQELNLRAQVNFLGLLDRERIRELIQNSHVLVSSSFIETFGVTLVEAMSCGRPVIASRSGGPNGFVNRENGILIPKGDIDALSQAMMQMYNSWEAYDEKKIRANCIARFGENTIVGKLEHIYKQQLDAM